MYVGAFAPDTGESALSLSSKFPGSTLGETLTAYPVSTGGNERLAIRADAFHPQFCADVPAETAALMAATQRPVTEASLSEGLPTDAPAWKQLPSWFVYGDADLNIPAELQRFAAERAGSRGTRELAGGLARTQRVGARRSRGIRARRRRGRLGTPRVGRRRP